MNLSTGERLRMAREERGLTRPKLQEKTGIKASRIAYLEADNTLPTIEEAKELSSALRIVSAAYLLGLENPPTTLANPAQPPRLPTPISTVTTEDIVDHLVVNCRLNKEEATDFLSTWFDDIRAKISAGESVRLSGLGTMNLQQDKKGIKKVTFSPAAAFKAKIEKIVG